MDKVQRKLYVLYIYIFVLYIYELYGCLIKYVLYASAHGIQSVVRHIMNKT